MPPRVRPSLHRDLAERTPGGDAGFTVLESLVSLVILALIGAASLTAIVGATRTSTSSTDRVVAADLAQSDQNAAQALRYPNYPPAIAAQSVKVGTTTYTVTRSVASACPSTPNYTNNPYMTVTTTVSWPPGGPPRTIAMTQELAC